MAILGALAYNDLLLPAEPAARHSLASVYAALMERPRTVFPGQWAPAGDVHYADSTCDDLDPPAPATAHLDHTAAVEAPITLSCNWPAAGTGAPAGIAGDTADLLVYTDSHPDLKRPTPPDIAASRAATCPGATATHTKAPSYQAPEMPSDVSCVLALDQHLVLPPLAPLGRPIGNLPGAWLVHRVARRCYETTAQAPVTWPAPRTLARPFLTTMMATTIRALMPARRLLLTGTWCGLELSLILSLCRRHLWRGASQRCKD